MKHFSILISSLGTAILIAVILILGFIGMQHYFERKPDLQQLMQQAEIANFEEFINTYRKKFPSELIALGEKEFIKLKSIKLKSQIFLIKNQLNLSQPWVDFLNSRHV